MNSSRIWIFRGLTLAGLGMLLYTWFQPWWSAFIEALDEVGAVIYPFKMLISGTLRDYPQWIVGYEMPAWFFPLMWIYLSVLVGLLAFGILSDEFTFNLGKLELSLPQVLIALAGFAYIVFVVVFPIVISVRAPQFHGVPLQGSVFISMNEHTESYVISSLQTGYWLACCTAGFLFSLGLLRTKIVGQPVQQVAVKPGLNVT